MQDQKGGGSDRNVRLEGWLISKVEWFECFKTVVRENGQVMEDVANRSGDKKRQCCIIKKNNTVKGEWEVL